jgi:hypothetical protein
MLSPTPARALPAPPHPTGRIRSGAGLRRRMVRVLVAMAILLGALVPPQSAQATGTWMSRAPRTLPGWTADFADDFKTLDTSVWGRYAGGPPVGAVSKYQLANASVNNTAHVDDGVLELSTIKTPSGWTSAGLSSGRGFWATQGKWAIKAKFDRAPGVGYAFLLFPKGGGWPPEVDIAEGTAGGPHVMSTLHWGTSANHQQSQRWLRGLDMSKWHTYGVTLSDGLVEFTVDGRVWSRIENPNSPTVPMWIGLQAGVKKCTEISGECLSPATPSASTIQVDWVAHYKKV